MIQFKSSYRDVDGRLIYNTEFNVEKYIFNLSHEQMLLASKELSDLLNIDAFVLMFPHSRRLMIMFIAHDFINVRALVEEKSKEIDELILNWHVMTEYIIRTDNVDTLNEVIELCKTRKHLTYFTHSNYIRIRFEKDKENEFKSYLVLRYNMVPTKP